MNRARSISPGLMLLPHPIADEVHGTMQGGRNNDDGQEAQERVPGEESRDGPRRNYEAQEECAGDEVVLVEARGFGAPRQMHPPFHERADEVAEKGTQGKDAGGDERHSRRTEGPRRGRPEQVKREGEEESEDRAGGRTADQSSPGLAVSEDPLPVGKSPASIDRPASAGHHREGVGYERREKEPQGLGDRLEGHRSRRKGAPRI